MAARLLTDITGPMGPVGQLNRGLVPDGTNMNNWRGNTYVGLWYIASGTSAATIIGLPPGTDQAGNFMVLAGPPGYSFTTQEFYPAGSVQDKYTRTMQDGTTWGPWKKDVTAGAFVPNGTDFNTWFGLRYVNEYYIATTADANTMLNLPSDRGPGVVKVMSGPPGFSHTTQIYFKAASPATYIRSTTGSGTWGSWEPLGGGGSSDFALDHGHYGTPNMQLISDFEAATPQISTGNKGAIGFRFDHGLTYLKSDILPLLHSRGWKCIIAMNSRNWDKAENSGMTQAELTALIDTGLVEIGNHTADGNATGSHKDMDTKAALWDGIVVGKRELEAQLGRPVYHFIVPGTVNGMGGFLQGANMDVYSGTYAGSLILAHHAVAAGGLGEVYRVLDGRTKQCQRHWNIEAQTVATIKSRIDTAASTKTGLQLMMHPRYIDQPGYLSKAQLMEVLAYIDSKVTSNELMVLSTSEMVRAKL